MPGARSRDGSSGSELGALRWAVWNSDQVAADKAWRELGRRAASEGWERRFILDVAHGRLSLASEAATPALSELASVAPDILFHELHGADPTFASSAGMALGCHSDVFHGELVALSQSPEVSLRLAAVAGLAEEVARGSTAAVDELGKRLTDSAGEVRSSAVRALGRTRGREAAAWALDWLARVVATGEDRMLSAAAFAASSFWATDGRAALRLLGHIAQAGSAGKRAVAAAAAELPNRRVARLADQLARDSDPLVRVHIATAFGRWAAAGNAVAARNLRHLAKDPDPAVRAALAGSLAENPFTLPALFEGLVRDRSALVREAVAQGLSRSTHARAIEYLIHLAGDRAARARAAALQSLANLKARDAPSVSLPKLLQVLDRMKHSLRRQSSRAGASSPRASDALMRALAATWIEPTGEEETRLLLSLSHDRRAEVSRAAARTLARHLCALSPEARIRVAELAREESTMPGVAEGIAAALDQDPKATLYACRSLPPVELTPGMIWMIARAARTPEAADLARAAARALEGGSDMGEALRDLAKALRWTDADDAADECSWVADCAEAVTPGAIAELAAPPSASGPSVPSFASIARVVRNALRKRCAECRVRNLGRARAEIGICLDQCHGHAYWQVLRKIAETWQRALGNQDFIFSSGERQAEASTRPTAVQSHGQPVATESADILAVRGPTVLAGISNPYVVGKPLAADSDMFFGREADMAFVERSLASGEGGGVVVLVGQRRMGKTSLLKRLEAQFARSYRYHPTFIDVQGMLVADTITFFQELARRTLSSGSLPMLSERGWDATGLGAEMVREAAEAVGRRVVLLLDEFDDLEQKVRSGVLSAEVFSQLRHLIQHSGNIGLVLCGTHRLEALAGEHWSFLLNLAAHRRVGPLETEVAQEVIRVPLGKLGIVCDSATLLHIVELSGRHPYFLQLLGYRLVERCVESNKAEVYLEQVEEIATEVVEQGAMHLRYLWDIAGSQGQPVVRALAAEVNGLTIEELSSTTDLTARQLHRTVRELERADLVVEQAGRYRLQIGLLSRWITHGGLR